MDDQGNTREDLKLPADTDDDNKLTERIRAAVEAEKDVSVTVMSAMKTEKVVDMLENLDK